MKYLLPVIALAPGFAAPLAAQESEPPAEIEATAAVTLPDNSVKQSNRLSANVGTGLVTEYISRGVLFAKEVSLQPQITVTLDLPSLEGGAITGANVFVGSWSSIKLGPVPSGSGGRLTRFYETDLYAGAAIELADRWAVSGTYYRYESLGNSFAGYNDFEVIVSFDDTGMWDNNISPAFSLSPSLRLVQEAGRPGRKDALYIQPSLTPSFDTRLGNTKINLAFPIVVGLSDEYYDGTDGGKKTFGFFRTGMIVSGKPAPRAAPGLTLSGGFDLWVPNSEVKSGLDQYDVVGRIGLDWSL
ncbi:hypothetical protein MB02_11990 [Croceicoccus estronivorus]|uniref:hypothetical protein n=1 Tax=Croceicoccus estronivorus TaxID=1172626 RepID=UPI00082FE3A8|nr:hypothetical protein [Croceicoccus estronivorus]OCC23343.1 hypothetical protein MB02_11990 [Croceicoccus estronivorus]